MLRLQRDDESGILTVSGLNSQIKALLENKFPFVWVKGEISNFRVPASGHYYFTLKDSGSQINAVFFRAQNRYLRFVPESGMQVLCQARLSVYEPRGDYQLIVEVLEPLGAGQLQLAFENLKKKLDQEGLFEPARKKALPLCPLNVCVVTSSSGAALRDILKVLEASPYPVGVTILPVAVQGGEAKFEITEALRVAGMLYDRYAWDVLIVGRGGGSIEDLWAFNEEIVARAIGACSIPTICAVGHEIDFTIADMVADMRAPTPTAAAEWVVRRLEEFDRELSASRDRLIKVLRTRLDSLGVRLKLLEGRITHPLNRLANLRLTLDDRLQRLNLSLGRRLEKERSTYEHLLSRLIYQNPDERIRKSREHIGSLAKELSLYYRRIVDGCRLNLQNSLSRLETLNPLSVLLRGYSITYRLADGKVIRSFKQANPGERVMVRLAEGRLECVVERPHNDRTEKEG